MSGDLRYALAPPLRPWWDPWIPGRTAGSDGEGELKFNNYPFVAAKVDKHEAVEDAGELEKNHERLLCGFEANGRRYFLDENKVMRWEPVSEKEGLGNLPSRG